MPDLANPIELSIVIPVYNDQEGLLHLLPVLVEEAEKLHVPFEILCVDDGSQPSIQVPERFAQKVHLMRHKVNRGYGAAIKHGIRNAQGRYVAVMDADRQHDPRDLHKFVAKIQNCDLVVGIRSHFDGSPSWRKPGRYFLRVLLNSMSSTKLQDINCGYRCVRRDVIQPYLNFCSDGFSFSISSTTLMLGRGHDVEFQEIHVQERLGKSTVKVVTGLQTIILVIRLIVMTQPLRFFLPISFAFLLAGVAWSVPYAWQGKGISIGALFLMISGVLTFFFGVLSDQLAGLLKR